MCNDNALDDVLQLIMPLSQTMPPDTHAVFELLPPQGDALATYVEWAYTWERCLCLWCLTNPTRCTVALIPPPPPVPQTISHPPPSVSLLFIPSVASSPLFRPHSSLFHLPRSACLRSTPPAFLQHMPGLLGHQLHSEDFI